MTTNKTNKTNVSTVRLRYRDISTAALHIIAMLFMLMDHLWATLLPAQDWLTCVGRVAFPIFAFMAVEGYFHTHSFKKYAQRLLVFALLSEIPFDLMYGGTWFYPVHQNVIWTLLLGLLGIHLMETVRKKQKTWLYLLTALLVVLIGSILCVRGEMTEGEFVSFAIYNTMSISPVRRLGRVISEMSKAGVSVSRIGEILDAPCEQDRPDAKELPMDGDIVFDHVSFRYETGPDVLSDVSFTIPAGSSFGILGGTGSGKSSLLLMLCRLYAPSEGRVTVGGEDLADMPAAWVRDHVGVVLQEPFLFSRTIEENIGICGADRETVRKAAATACIASDIEQFANGYETMVGERGVTLSGGQKQRVAIARMLTKKTPVMVFDDSLSAVDTQTDEHIREALNRDLAGTTTIIISHRITTLMDCDNILVLEHGKVLQRGTPQELLRQPGLFRQIYDMQMSIGEEEPA